MESKLKNINYLFLFLFLIGCSTIDVFNQRAYEQAVDVKVESQLLLIYADEPFADYKDEVKMVKSKALKAYEYAKGRKNNEESAKQWEIMVDPEKNMLFGVLKRWEDEGQLNPVFMYESSKMISDGFDTIIQLESGKIKIE